MSIIVYKKMTITEAIENIQKIEKWFSENKTRKICRTDLFKVRRGFVGTDIFKRTNLN